VFHPDKADTATLAVLAAAADITGTSDPAAQVAALADPAKAQALQIALAKLAAQWQAEQRTTDLAALQAAVADVASARSQTLTLAASHNAMAWGAPLVSGFVLLIFCVMLAIVLEHGLPPSAESLANVMLGALAGMTTAVVNYWVGSTASSKGKDLTIAQQSHDLATSVPLVATVTPSDANGKKTSPN
jgi:hypothetical protein